MDDFHTPAEIPSLLNRLWPDAAAVNEPFRGCYIPMGYCRRSPAVSGVMLEIRRDTFTTDDAADPDRAAEIISAMGGFFDALEN